MPGTITFKPIEANITRNTELIGKMDPYCLFHVGDQKIKGQVCKKGGKHPMWEDIISVPVTNQPICTVDIKDKDILLDDKIGTFEVDLREIESQGMTKKWYPIFHKDKPAGEILMEAVFTGSLAQGQSSNLGQQGLNQTNLTSGQQGLSAQSNLIGGAPYAGSALAGGAIVGSTLPTGTAPVYANQGTMNSAPLSTGLPVGQSSNLGLPVSQSTLNHGPNHVLNASHFIDGYPRLDHKQQGIPHESHGVTPHNLPTSGLPHTYGGIGGGSIIGQGFPSAEQYAQEALMRGIDPLNTQALGLSPAGIIGSQIPVTQSTLIHPQPNTTNYGGMTSHLPTGHMQTNLPTTKQVVIEETYTKVETKAPFDNQRNL